MPECLLETGGLRTTDHLLIEMNEKAQVHQALKVTYVEKVAQLVVCDVTVCIVRCFDCACVRACVDSLCWCYLFK